MLRDDFSERINRVIRGFAVFKNRMKRSILHINSSEQDAMSGLCESSSKYTENTSIRQKITFDQLGNSHISKKNSVA